MSSVIRRGRPLRVLQTALSVTLLSLLLLAASASTAVAAEPTPAWSVRSAGGTDLMPDKELAIQVLARNVGTAPAPEVTLTGQVPAGLEVKSVAFYWEKFGSTDLNKIVPICPTPAGSEVTCTFALAGAPVGPGKSVRMAIQVVPSGHEGPVAIPARVEGSGAPAAAMTVRDIVTSHPEFAITNFSMQTIDRTIEHEMPDPKTPPAERARAFENVPSGFAQAGGHAWALATTGEVASVEERDSSGNEKVGGDGSVTSNPVRDPKDVVVALPPGLLGNPVAVPRCPLATLTGEKNGEPEFCPADTVVGWVRLTWFGGREDVGSIVNVTPAPGESAEFALELDKVRVQTPLLTAHLVHSANGEYGFAVLSNGISKVGLQRFELTFWGVPADASHDAMRGIGCGQSFSADPLECDRAGNHASGVPPVPFLSLPSDCAAGPETATMRADSWEEPGSVREGKYEGYKEASTVMPAVTGCDALSFSPGIEVQPDNLLADAPVGLGVDVSVPQNEEPGALATPHLRDATVTLPAGVSISPGIIDGIQACNESGPEGINFEGPESEEVGLSGELQLAPGKCPNASTVGTAEAITPLLPEPVKGHVYLARPKCGGAGEPACTNQDALDGNLYQLYLELGGTGPLANEGVNIKAHGYVEANPATGQLTTKFLENPQAPFSELKIRLNGGPRAPLDNPATCGQATTTADFTPWSAPGMTSEGLVAGTPDATPSSFFNVDLAGDGLGTPCPSLPFAPGFSAGNVSPQAAQFSSFTMNLTRQDREQYVKGIQVHTPPGLLGMLSSVPLCEEPLADSGHCPGSSRIGSTRVASGAGSHPFEISGTVYLTKGYGGAPFGLSIVTNAVAGPFNLGLVVVRAKIAVNPVDSSLTITTDETGPYAIPQILFGVPLRLKQVTVNIDRPGFMFNPTNCKGQQITAAVSGSGQAVANVSSPFAAGGCKSLAFKPGFTVATSGKTSRLDGASLDAKLTFPAFKAGSEANISYVKVELPKQLPTRLTAIQKACLAATFERNPAGCPRQSILGIAKASTPLLPVKLEGPVYFVSHGGEAFPSLIVVLQGDGVRVDLTGTTLIKHGVTSTTFKTVPDVPVSSFELYLPEGPYSALGATSNLCTVKGGLKMPTEFTAQNGATLKQNTKITVTNCSKHKPKPKRKHDVPTRHRRLIDDPHPARKPRDARHHGPRRLRPVRSDRFGR